jgi:diaminopimelate epimerase
MRFEKWQGLGNDFLVVDEDQLDTELTPELAQAVCHRNFGVGADGILVLGGAQLERTMVIHNADGSQPEMCGNGIRVAAGHLVASGAVERAAELVIATAGGDMRPRVLDDGRVRVDMGIVHTPGRETVETNAHGSWEGRIVDVGNPHFVVTADPASIALDAVGPALENHSRFPNRTNVEFFEQIDGETVRMRVWERGVGETLACGTGACAVALTAQLDAGAGNPVTVLLPGGPLEIEIEADQRVFMTGAATHVYTGEIDTQRVLTAWRSFQDNAATKETALS